LPGRGELACLFILLAMITWLQSVALQMRNESLARIYKKRGYVGDTYFALQSSAFQTLCSLAKIQITAYFSTEHTDRLGIASPAGCSTVDISNSADARRLSDIVGRGDGKVQQCKKRTGAEKRIKALRSRGRSRLGAGSVCSRSSSDMPYLTMRLRLTRALAHDLLDIPRQHVHTLHCPTMLKTSTRNIARSSC